MPVNPIPILISALALIALVVGLTRGKRTFVIVLAIVAFFLLLIIAPFYVEGARIRYKASNDPKEMYRYARWLETTPERIGNYILWFGEPDVLGGYTWLERSAHAGYPAAMYAVGIRLKYGIHVPEPPNWSGPAGNVFPQPQAGQEWIEKAKKAGFKPPELDQEEYYYWHVYRGLYQKDENA